MRRNKPSTSFIHWVMFTLLTGWPLLFHAQIQTLPFQHLTLGPGQDINMVNEILQDRQGFMWFGTHNGLVRYDGYRLKHYPYAPETKHPWKGRGIHGLLESLTGNIWIISGQMLLSYNSRQDSFYHIKNLGGKPKIGFNYSRFSEVFLQDSSGNLWVRSLRGLFSVREKQDTSFEVQHFRFETGDTNFLTSDPVHALFCDSRHRLWAGTRSGPYFYDRENDRMVQPGDGCKVPVISLCETASGKICMGTQNNGLYVYDPETGTFENYLPNPTIDRSTTNNESSIAGKWVRQIVQDGKDNIWLLAGNRNTQMVTLQRFDPETGAFRSYFDPFPPKGLSRNSIAQLFVDRTGFLWVATGADLKRFDPYQEVFAEIQQRETYLKDWMLLFTFYEDPNRNLWIGTVSRGILKYAPSTDKFRFYPPPLDAEGKNIEWNFIKPIFEDSRGHLWKKMPDGTDRFVFDENDEPQKVAHFPFDAFNFWEDSQNRLWIATNEELKGFDVNTGQFLPSSAIPDLKGRYYIAKEDREGRLWAVSLGEGVKRYNPSTGEMVHFKNLRANPVILEDREGNTWFNGRNGLKKYDPRTGKFSHYLKGMETVHAIWGKEGVMWVTTSGRGLYRFDTKTGERKHYVPQNGFPALRPIAIFKDRNGTLWMSSDVGVIRFDPETKTSFLYDESDGLPGVVFSYGSYQRKNGEFFFPLWEGGFIRFHPDSLQVDSITPRPAIVDFRLFNKPVEIGGENSPLQQAIWATKELTLQHDQNNFTLDFTAFHYAAPAHNQLLYKMEGIDKDWNDPAEQRSVNFAGLSPGLYTFLLKAANHDGIWSEPVSLKITILPPWWATWWAYLLYFILLAATAFAFYIYKKRQWQLQAQLELEHREAERLKEIDAVKTRLYTNITHEFRTPLTVILGMAEQMQTNPREWYSKGLKLIVRNGRNLLHLVNQMLDLSKLEAGVLPVNRVQSDVIVFLKYVLESFHSLAETKNIQLYFRSDLKELTMDFDPEKLRKIISNLLSNAIKFTPEGGAITLEARISKAGQTGPDCVVLAVNDTGPGIPPEKLPHIFDRFYQADDDATHHAEGTGIGLALTKELVNLLGGHIAVESGFEKGTTFLVNLPVRREASIQPVAIHEKADAPVSPFTQSPIQYSKTDRPHLLIIEDNPDVVVYLRSCLQHDYQLTVAKNGKEGVEKALKQVPDLIVSDVMMPGMDGFEVCEKLKTDFRTSHIPVVLLTAKADISSKIAGLQKGADAYLTKPFHREELLVRLQKLLELRKRLQERYTAPSPGHPTAAEFQIEDAFMQKVRGTMEAHLGDELFGIPELCKELGMSRSQLYRKFSALTDESIGHYFRSMRLNRANELLLTTDLSISEIAYRVGFKDPAHFSRSFKEEFGHSPSEVRKG